MRRVLLISLAIVIGPACAARGPSPQLLADIGKADMLLRDGCYRCLEDALAIYERAAAAPRPPAGAQSRVFDALVLLAVRAKELGMPPDAHLAKARDLASQLPAPLSPALPYAAYLEAVDYIQGELSGFDPEMRQTRVRRPSPASAGGPSTSPQRLALQPAVATSIVAEYLAIAIDCDDARARKEMNAASILARSGGAPLIKFRLAMCGLSADYLLSLREADPRWVDTLFTEGRRHISTRPVGDVQKAVQSYAAAHAAFPDSDAITLALAHAQNMLTEYDAALGNFDAVIAKHATHRDAILGRVLSLSYLSRHDEAVASATRLLDLGMWHLGDAYYWRAWNRYHLKELDSAWDDIERGTKLMVNTSVYTLAGFIAYARKEPEVAIDRFDRAFAMDKSNCEAVWMASLVHVDLQQWSPAAPKFATAMSCLVAAAAEARRQIDQLQASTLDEALKARRIAVQQKIADTSDHRAAQAAFNAAQCFVRLGDKGLALNHIDVAIEHPLMREKAIALKAAIEKMP